MLQHKLFVEAGRFSNESTRLSVPMLFRDPRDVHIARGFVYLFPRMTFQAPDVTAEADTSDERYFIGRNADDEPGSERVFLHDNGKVVMPPAERAISRTQGVLGFATEPDGRMVATYQNLSDRSSGAAVWTPKGGIERILTEQDVSHAMRFPAGEVMPPRYLLFGGMKDEHELEKRYPGTGIYVRIGETLQNTKLTHQLGFIQTPSSR